MPELNDTGTTRPEVIPRPTYWPAPALALGVALFVWGLASSWIVSASGALVMIAAVAGWIYEGCHERES